MKKHLILVSLCGLLIGFAACTEKASKKNAIPSQDTIPVKVMSLKVEDASQIIATSGLLTTDDETLLSFKTGGVINKIYVKEGDQVHKGKLLASLNLTEISAQVAQVKLSYQKASRDFERAQRLYLDSVATLEQMQNAKTALQVAKQQVDAVSFNRDYAEIRATTNGYVLKKFANDGQIVGPGSPVLQINGANENKWILKTGLSDAQWAIVKIGDHATVQTETLAGQTLSGQVTRKSESIDPQSGTFGIEITLDNVPTKGLATGLFAKATIVPSQNVSGYFIPYDALLDGNENEGYVFVTNDYKTVQKIKVRLGAIQKDKIAVQSGLENSNALIVSGSPYLTDGSNIRVLK